MPVRGIRGAVCVARNDEAAVMEATAGLLRRLIAENGIDTADMAAIFFTATPDLNACYPAAAARSIGLVQVPLFGACELNPPGAMPRCVRVLVLLNTEKSQAEMRHVYLGEASALRPDWA